MTEPVVIRWPIPDHAVLASGPITCPTCGGDESLTLAMDLHDRSDDPSYMSCPVGHIWAEERFPRIFAAELLDEILQIDPSILGHLDELREIQERRQS
jgi:hypothetical protein